MWLRTVWYILTLRCEEADRLRCAPDRSALSRHQRVAERIHRGLCAGCRRAARQLEAIDAGLQDLASSEQGSAHQSAHTDWNAERAARLKAGFVRETGEPGSDSRR